MPELAFTLDVGMKIGKMLCLSRIKFQGYSATNTERPSEPQSGDRPDMSGIVSPTQIDSPLSVGQKTDRIGK